MLGWKHTDSKGKGVWLDTSKFAWRSNNWTISLTYPVSCTKNFEKVKAKFMRAVDYVEETHTHAEFAQEQGGPESKRYVERSRNSRLAETKIASIRATLGR